MWIYSVKPTFEESTVFNQKLATINPENDLIIAASTWRDRKMIIVNGFFTYKYFGLSKPTVQTMLGEVTGLNIDRLNVIFDKLELLELKPITDFFDYKEECKGCMRCNNSRFSMFPWTGWLNVHSDYMPSNQGCRQAWSTSGGVSQPILVTMGNPSESRSFISGSRSPIGGFLTLTSLLKNGKVRVVFSTPVPESHRTELTGKSFHEFSSIDEFNRFCIGITYLNARFGQSAPAVNVNNLTDESFAHELIRQDNWQLPVNKYVATLGHSIDIISNERKSKMTEMAALKIIKDNFGALITGSINDFLKDTFPGKSAIEIASDCFTVPIPEEPVPAPVAVAAVSADATPVKKMRKSRSKKVVSEEATSADEEEEVDTVDEAILAQLAVPAPAAPAIPPALNRPMFMSTGTVPIVLA